MVNRILKTPISRKDRKVFTLSDFASLREANMIGVQYLLDSYMQIVMIKHMLNTEESLTPRRKERQGNF